MILQTLKLKNFRTYKDNEFEFSPQLNLALGLNGTGKTNLLEAIYVLSNGGSWRARDKDLINYHADFYRVLGEFEGRGASVSYQLTSQGPQKNLAINNNQLKTREYLGRSRVVLFEPGSLNIIIGPPADRRRWLNQVLAVSRPAYLDSLLKYRHILKQRNALLKKRNLAAVTDQIFAWDVSLVEAAGQLVKHREKLVNLLDKYVNDYYRQLSDDSPQIGLRYICNVEAGDYTTALLAKLESGVERDMKLGFTSTGPHRDDVAVSFNHKPAHLSASRGEVRTLVLTMKLIESRWLSGPKNKPILLFDDVFSELDGRRRQFVLSHLKKQQVFITATDIKGLKPNLPRYHQTIKLH